MKIAIFTDTYKPEINGVVTSTKTFLSMLLKDGHEVILICPKYKGFEDKKVKNLKIFRFLAISFITNKDTKLALPSLAKIIKILKKEKPDLIHIQTPMNIGIAGITASKILKIKNIQTYHTYIPEMMVYLKPSRVLGFEKIKELSIAKDIVFKILENGFYKKIKEVSEKTTIKQLKAFSKINIKHKSEKAVWAFTKGVYNRADMVLTPSEALVRILKKRGISPPVYFQTNGIDFSGIKVKSSYKKTGKIVHFGRLGLEKRIDVVIKALAKTSDIELDIYGDGPARESLEKLSLDLLLGDRVRFFGFVPNIKVKKIISNYDLFVTASPMETQGIVILEAMAAGLPVIGPKKLAIPDLIKDGVNGFVVDSLNPLLFAKSIKDVLGNEKIREKMGISSRELAMEHQIDKAYKNLLKRYESLIG